MDPLTIALLTLALALILAIMVIAGLVLSARAFTQLAGLVRWIGYLAALQGKEIPQAPITLSNGTGTSIESLDQNGTRTMLESPDSTTTG